MEAHKRFEEDEASEEKGGRARMGSKKQSNKPYFVPAKDDTKPLLQDPISRSDPIEAEEAVLVLPPFPVIN
ncbi:unnamed protein product [Cuscuta campestris]|nr:unnamed protein product [Cuscuta campestris]